MAAFNVVGGAALVARGNLLRLRRGFIRLGETSQRSAGLISGVGIALGAAIQIWDQAADRTERVAANAERAADIIAAADDTVSRFATSGNIFRSFLADDDFADVVTSMETLGLTVDSLDRAFVLAEGDASKFITLLGEAFQRDLVVTEDFERFIELFNAVGDGFDLAKAREATGVVEEVGINVEELGTQAEEAAEELPDFSDAISTIVAEGKPAAAVLDDVNSAMADFIGNLFFDDTEASFFKALRDLDELLDDDGFDGNFDPNASDEAFEIAEQLNRIVGLAAELAAEEAVASNLTDAETAAYFDTLVAQMLETLGLGDQVNEKIDGIQENLDATRDELLITLKDEGRGEFERSLAKWLAEVEAGSQLFISPTFGGNVRPGVYNTTDPGTGGNGLNTAPPVIVGAVPDTGPPQKTGPGGATSGPSATSGASRVVLEVDGRELADVVVEAINATGGAPIEIRGSR